MTDPYTDAIVSVVRGMSKSEPKPMLKRVRFELDDAGVGDDFSETDLVDAITSADSNSPARFEFHIQLSKWDAVSDAAWAPGAPEHSVERRSNALTALGFSDRAQERINHAFQVSLSGATVISDKPADWDPWYHTEGVRSFYWDGYRGVLESKGWDATAIGELSRATDEVVKRLANPERDEPYQSKGLVVGHVQSGKTANFTGVIAKAIDAGYKLIIVLTGTIELLRSQTQRRLDMELVGEENILGGVPRDDDELTATVDYIGSGDIDWLDGKFVSYGKDPRELGFPGIRRLTGASDDYKLLKAGLGFLDFRQTDHLVDPARPLYDPLNLYRPDIRIAVVKKNSTVLKKLVSDLKSTKTDLGEIPTLIIDDEADQASINTTRPKKPKDKESKEARERTAINGWISELLIRLKRAQYIGYTATPFANVFVDPEDSEDLFPKDFIVSLDPPPGYMGGKSFHDLDDEVPDVDDTADEERTVANSNEKAFVRSLVADPDDMDARDKEMLQALDAYVLAGAVKLHRSSVLGQPKLFRHHTMLVHESVNTAEHAALANDIRKVWASAGYDLPMGLKRLQDLWNADFRQVTEARAPEAPAIAAFADLITHIGHAVDKIQEGVNPVVIVNGVAEKDYLQDDINFQAGDVWKILVGGAKLSRGFTVEGLTVSYYTRRTMAADTLMQMGRWFGYRAGYRDLVRLYIGRNVPGPRNTVVDLYRSFQAVVRDEEDFREELRRFQGFNDDGRPRVRPMDVPPLVYQSLPYLKPTSGTKMYNAELTEQGEGGKVVDFNQQGEHDDQVNSHHFEAVQDLLDAANADGEFFYINPAGAPRPWYARYGIVDAESLIDVVGKFRWANNFRFDPYVAFMRKAIKEGTLKDWVVIVPQIALLPTRTVCGRELKVMRRFRRDDRPWQFSGSSTRQRDALYALSNGIDAETIDVDGAIAAALELPEYAHIKGLRAATRGAFLLTFAGDSTSARFHDAKGVTDPKLLPDVTDPKHIATLFSCALPLASAPAGRIAFKVRRKDLPDDPIVTDL
ncbi:Z1 domain-containing protein [Gordonia sp. (in: high G+C Gram-positive bacteria)]|uniref:Z1 domain-containing protein n=1 Tax=Gordonia sp. (in: high G+C Gram-positive bacteria) TaxID=84139 RepID=UPI00199908D6|nr:Z1 domain-containing protein [Gordonia sp. (in: high G+C Gram-positive bacteria)]MBD0022533.1 Z1 domain-containing protein [Gordonia sp. (in: high G+C Gram-positive bacteria)]